MKITAFTNHMLQADALEMHGQSELNSCARTCMEGSPQTAAMGLDDRTTDRQPHAEPLRFCRHESGEDAVQVLRVDAPASVLHGDADGIGLLSLRPDDQ